MKTKFRVFTALLLALMVLVSVLPLQAAAEIGQSGTATRAEAENTAEAALSVKPMLTPSYTPSASYRSGKYYTQLCNVSLTGNQRTDLVNVARSQLGYHEGDSIEDLNGTGSGSGNYSEYGYWFGTQVKGNTYGHYYAWCAMFVSWCARQAGIPTSVISNAAYAHADGSNSSGGYSYFHVDYKSPTEYTPQEGDLIFFDKASQAGEWDHVGIVIGVSNGQVYTIEGNASNAVISGSYPLTDAEIQCYGLPKYVNGEPDGGTLSNTEVINQKIDYLNNNISYFTTTGSACGTYESNHHCDKCLNTHVVASSWFRNLFGSVSVNNFPEVYDSDGSCYSAGWSCYGFANFAEWYIFKSSNSSSVNVNKIGSYSFNYSNMSRYAQPGDLISFDTHYAIFISADSSNGIYVLDSNWDWGSSGQCHVYKHYIPYSHYNTATINRSTNAPSTSPDPTTPPDVENGNWQYRVTGSAGLNVRSGPSTDYPVLTAIPKGTIVTVTQRTSTNWGKMTYNGTTGWGCLDYCELVTSNPTPTPTPTPTPAPSGGVQDLTNPKNPNKYSTPPSGTYLNVGDSGTYVRWLQACLNQCGYSCDVDGQFGYGTAEALKGFQRAYGLTVDGGFGPECRTKILEVLTVAAPTITTAYDANGTRVTISGSSGTTIFYTTNGSTPTESSNKYTGSFVLNGAATVKAVAMQNCRYNSHVSSYGITVTKHTVTFKDWNGTVLKTQSVYHTGAATAPANPTRPGYTFTGWDKAFTNVTANLVVTAQYVQNEPVSTPVPSDAPQIVVESKTTSAGSTVAVNISIANNPGIVSMTLHVNFDSRLELVSVQDTGLLPGKVHSTVMLNPYTLAWENDSATQNYTVNGTLVTLTFNVPENLEEGDYAVSVSYDSEGYEIYDFNAEPVDFAVVNGKISVTDIIYGDVNGDGKVNNLDRLILTRYLANWPDYPASRIKPGADTNADGKINNLDRLILTRHLANWPDYATLPWSSGKSNASVVGAESGTKDNEPKIIVNGVEAAPGDTVSVGIEIANNPGIISMTLDVAFDPALTLLRVEDTGLLPGTVPCTVMQNPFTLVWTNDSASENFCVNGTLTYFVFKVADNAEPGAYNITVTYNLDEYDIYDCNAEPVEFAVQNGAVTVAAAQPEMHTVTFKDWDGTVLKTQEVQHGGDAEAPADPTRVGYTFTGWDKVFTNITADLIVTAQYEINTYTVTFKDWDGTVLKTQEVQHGGDAEAPADPTRTGYTFTGWDKAFTNVTADLVVTAQYEINTYTVTFKDWNGNVLKTQEVQHGGDAEAPADPTRTGYTFTGWDKAFTNIMADLVVTAQYEINTYTVTFKDWNGTVLKTQEVQYGGDAEAPADPTRTGYTFTGWDKAFTNVTADLVVTAQYEINTYTVTFKDWDGTVLKTQEVQYGGDAEAPADPTRVGYTFTGWDKAFTNITADLVVTAQYEMLGDVDGDGNVSMADALTILRMAMDILPVENQQIADVDGDGFITSMDALLALRFAMHIEQ